MELPRTWGFNKQLQLDEVSVKSRIINVEVVELGAFIGRSRRLWRITLTETLII